MVLEIEVLNIIDTLSSKVNLESNQNCSRRREDILAIIGDVTEIEH